MRSCLRAVVLAVTVTLWVGCARQTDAPPPAESPTDALRRTLDPAVRALLLEGDAAFQEGRYGRALALADSAETRVPMLADIPYFRGNVYMAQQRYAEAYAAFQRVIALDSTFAGAWMRRGDIAVALGNAGEAVRAYRREALLAPTSAVYEKLGVQYAEAGVADSARWAYERALTMDSTNADAHLLYGQFLEKLGAYDEALVHSRRALALRPDNPNARFAVGVQLYRTGRLEEAVPYLRQAAEALPLHYPAQYNLAQVLQRLDRSDEAAAYQARADTARVLLGDITVTEEAAAREPGQVRHWIRLGRLYHRAGLYDRATQSFERAEDVDRGNLDAASGLATVAMALGRMNEAIQRLETVRQADPDRLEDRRTLGLAYAVSGRCPDARREWEAVRARNPGDETVRNYLEGLCRYQAQ